MGKKLYIGNLAFGSSEDGLTNYFSAFGSVVSAKIIVDRENGRSKGFGFVEMSTEEEAATAIAETNGKDFDGRPLRVNEAQDKVRRDRNAGGYQNW